jgi:hypothetical protein
VSAPPPIERPAHAVRPPYDVRDHRLNHLQTDTAAWRVAVRLDRVAALLEPLAGLLLSEHEHRVVEHLAGDDVPTVAVLARLLWAARLAAPIPGPVPDRR